MASTGRVLLEATVTDVGIGPFVYPACGQCYSKLIQLQDCKLHRCQNCGRSYSYGQEQFRYRLCLTVTDGTALASLTTFGGMLNSFFGVPATEFHNILMSSGRDKYGASYGTIIQVAIEQAFVGQRLLFGLKTISSNTRQTRSRCADGYSAISLRSICQSSTISSHKSVGRHLPDFIAVQIMPMTDSSFSATVVDCLRHLEAVIEECDLTPDDYKDRAALLQILHLHRSSNNDKFYSFPNSFMRHVIQSPTVNSSCDGTKDSSLDQSSLAFSCDDSLDTVFMPKRPGLTICTSQDPELTVCLPCSDVSAENQVGECRSHCENEDSVTCCSLSNKDEIGHSPIGNCLTIQQTDNSGLPKKTRCELVGVRKCITRSTDNCINGKLHGEYKNSRNTVCGRRVVNRSEVKVVGGQCDTDRHKMKTVCDQSDMTKREMNIAYDHSDVKKHTVQRVCSLSGVDRHKVKTICDQSGSDRHKIKTICSQNDVNRLACVSASKNHKHGYDQKYYTNLDIVDMMNKENIGKNVDTATTSCQIMHPLQRPAISNHQLSVRYSPVSVNKVFLRRRKMLKKRFSERHGLRDSLNTETEELASTSCPGNVKDCVVEMAGISDGHTEIQLTEDSSEQSQQKAHSDHVRLRLCHSDQSTIEASYFKGRSYSLAGDVGDKCTAQRYNKDICENVSQLTELLEDIPGKLMEEYSSKVMEDCLSKTREGNSSKLWEDYPESEGLDVFLSKITEDTPSTLMEGISSKLTEGISSKLMEGSPSKLMEGISSKLMEGTPSQLWEDYPESEGLDAFLSKIREDNQSKFMGGTLPEFREDNLSISIDESPLETQTNLVFLPNLREDNTLKLMEDYPSELMKDYPEFENLDVIMSPTRGDNLSKLGEVFSSTLMEVYPESEGVDAFLSQVREDNPLKLMKGSLSEFPKDYPQPEDLDVSLLSFRGDNASQLREDNPSQLRGDNPSQLRGDNTSQFRGDNPSQFRGDNPSQSRGDNTSQLRGNNPSQLRGDNPSQLRGDNPSQLRGDNPSQLRDACALNLLRNYPSKLMEDYPESERLGAFLRKLNSSTIDHSRLQSQDILAEKSLDEMHMKKLDDTAAGGTDYRTMMNLMLHGPTNDHSNFQNQSVTTENTAESMLMKKLHDIAAGSNDYRKGMSSNLHTCKIMECAKGRCDTGESCSSDAWLPSLVQMDSGHFEEPKKQTLSQLLKNSQKQRAVQSDQSCKTHGTFQNINTLQKRVISKDDKHSHAQSTPRLIHSSRDHNVSQNITIVKKHDASGNTKAVMKQDISRNVKSLKKEKVIRNVKTVKKQGMSPADENLRKQALFQAKCFKEDMFPAGENSRKQALFQAVQAHQKAVEEVKNLKTHTLCPCVSSPPVQILFPSFENHEETYNAAFVNTTCKVGGCDVFNSSEKLTLSKTVRNQNKQTLCQKVTNEENEMSLQNVTHSAEQTSSLHAVNSMESSDKCKIQKKQIAGHSKTLTLAGKVTSGKKLVLLRSCKNQERNTLSHFSKNVKKNTFSQSETNLGKEPVSLSVTTQKKWPPQHTIQKSKKHTLSLNYTFPEQILPNVKSPAKDEFFAEDSTPTKIPYQNMKGSEEMNFSVNSTNLKQRTSQKMDSLERSVLTLKSKTSQLLMSLHNCKDNRRKFVLNYATPKQTLPRNVKHSQKTLSCNHATPKQTLPRNMRNSQKTLSSKYTTPKQTLPRNMRNSQNTLSSKYATPKQTLPRNINNCEKTLYSNNAASKNTFHRNMKHSEKTLSSNYETRKQTLQRNVSNSEKTVSSNNTTPNQHTGGKIPAFSEYISSASDTTSKYPVSQQTVKNSENTTSTNSSKSPGKGALKLAGNTPGADYNSQSIDLNSLSVNVTLRRSKRKYHTDKLNERNNKTSTDLFCCESTNTEALSVDQVSGDGCVLTESPTGKISRLSHLDPWCESSALFQIADSSFHFNSGFIEMKSDRNVGKDCSIMSDRNVQNDSSRMFDRIVQKDSASRSDNIIRKDNTGISNKSVQKDNRSISHRNAKEDTNMSHRNCQKDGTSMSDRNARKDNTSVSNKTVRQDSTTLSPSNIQKDSSSVSDKNIPQGSTDRLLQSSMSGRQSTVHHEGVWDVSTTQPEIPSQTWLRGRKQSSGSVESLSSFVEKTNKSACVISEVFPLECVLDGFSGQGDSDNKLRESFCCSGIQGHETGMFTGQQTVCLENSGCNSDVMDVDNRVIETMDRNDRGAEITDKYDVAEITDLKGHVTKVIDTTGRDKDILNVTGSVTEITDVGDCLTEITNINNDVTGITDMNMNLNYFVTKITDVINHITEIADINHDNAEIRDKNGNITEMSFLKDISGSSEVLWGCPGDDIRSDSGVRELDVRWQTTATTRQLDVEVSHLHCESTEHHVNYGHVSSLPEETLYPHSEHGDNLICTCPNKDNNKHLIYATCLNRAHAISLNCDLGSMKASVGSGKYPEIMQTTESAFGPQDKTHHAEDAHKLLSDTSSDLFSSQEEDSVFATEASHYSDFGRETHQSLVQKTVLLPKSNVALARLDRSCSESNDGHWPRGVCGDGVEETLPLHKTYPTSDKCTRSYSTNQLGNASGGCQAAKQVRFSDKNQEHNYFAFEAIGHQPVVIQDMPYLRSSLKKSDTEWKPAGSQDLFSEPSQDLAPSNVSTGHGNHCQNDEFNSSCELFSQTPEQPSRKCVLLTHNVTSANKQESDGTNTPRMYPQNDEWNSSCELFSPTPEQPSRKCVLLTHNVTSADNKQESDGTNTQTMSPQNDEWNSSCELFSPTPEQPRRNCVLLTHSVTSAENKQESAGTNTPRMSRIGSAMIYAQSETLLTDHSFDLFTPSPSVRQKVNSVSLSSPSLFSPEVLNYQSQTCITPDLFS